MILIETDAPKTLASPEECERRRALLAQDHIRDLTAFVDGMRTELNLGKEIPHFDPLDGGRDARCLFLLEAPGAKAVASGFMSRNNPDESAKNFLLLNQEAGLPREETVLWNIVPWHLSDGTRSRAPKSDDIRSGTIQLARLLRLLDKLEAVVFVGGHAQKAEGFIGAARPELRHFRLPHPSPPFLKNKPENRDKILRVLTEVASELGFRAS